MSKYNVCCQDKKSQCIESMKVKIDITEVRVEKLTAELLSKTKEAQLFKVLHILQLRDPNNCLIHMQIPQIYALTSFLSMQNEAEVAFSESNILRKACEAADKAQEDLIEKSTVAQVVTGVPFLPTFTDSVRNSLKGKVFSKTICYIQYKAV